MAEPKDFVILVVDDDEVLREAIVFDFKRKGFVVFQAENGKKAFELILNEHIDLVISDIRMPDGDGLMLLDEVKKRDPKMPHVVLITGFAETSPEECIARGAMKVVAKPFNRRDLMMSIFGILGIEYF